MTQVQSFPMVGTEFLQSLHLYGLSGISSDRKDYGTHVSVSSVWLRLDNGSVLRFTAEMHDFAGWEEVGTLVIKRVDPASTLLFIQLDDEWKEIASIEKLVISEPNNFRAESGLKITNWKHESITICNSASPYQLALSTPVTHDVFNPEYSMDEYSILSAFSE